MLTAIVQDVAGIQGFERLAKEAGRTEDIPEIGGATSVGVETYRQRQIRWWARRYGNPVGDLIAVGIGSVEHRLSTTRGFLTWQPLPRTMRAFGTICQGCLRSAALRSGNRVKVDSSSSPVIARSEATRQSPSQCVRDGNCFAPLAMTGTGYRHAFIRLPWHPVSPAGADEAAETP